ncbi:ion transporter [Leptothrix ochracea]|uniref:ion transporter n=1 Tax=Leptothrix ochracea TaxID=735331 RepID=UPI0034E30199
MASQRSWIQQTWDILDIAQPGNHLGRAVNISMMALIVLNVTAVMLESVKELDQLYHPLFHAFEVFSVAVFSIEYVGRIWACVCLAPFSHPIKGRLRFTVQPMSLIDLLAILPFYLAFFPIDLRFLRSLRMFRLFRLAKLGRYSTSLRLFGRVFKNNKEELIVTACVMVMLIILTSSLMYFAEHDAQPDKFPDIPSTMWWSVVTLTTVGYGDIYPITALGKFFAGTIAIVGIGMFALPAGVLGSGFVAEIQKQKKESVPTCCPHCGREIED